MWVCDAVKLGVFKPLFRWLFSLSHKCHGWSTSLYLGFRENIDGPAYFWFCLFVCLLIKSRKGKLIMSQKCIKTWLPIRCHSSMAQPTSCFVCLFIRCLFVDEQKWKTNHFSKKNYPDKNWLPINVTQHICPLLLFCLFVCLFLFNWKEQGS